MKSDKILCNFSLSIDRNIKGNKIKSGKYIVVCKLENKQDIINWIKENVFIAMFILNKAIYEKRLDDFYRRYVK